MNLRTRIGTTIATAAIGILGVLGAAACDPSTTDSASMTPDATALTALGFSDSDVTTADDSRPVATATDSTAAPGRNGPGARRLRRLLVLRGLGRHIEHGVVTVQTKNGDQTIAVQRGTVTSITDTTVTVKSSDGYTLTWTFGNPIHVIEHRTTVQPKDITVGETIGIAGLQTGSTDTARLIVVPVQQHK
ncbi:MAG TPA: hypothetical protein VKB69_01475 [Micromonosporaceae bacterium]|nr:hypothetical protein [Micromonosporaceae bacterium]